MPLTTAVLACRPCPAPCACAATEGVHGWFDPAQWRPEAGRAPRWALFRAARSPARHGLDQPRRPRRGLHLQRRLADPGECCQAGARTPGRARGGRARRWRHPPHAGLAGPAGRVAPSANPTSRLLARARGLAHPATGTRRAF